MKPKAVPDTSFLIEHFRKETVQEAFLNLNRYYHIAFSSVVLMELLAGAFDPKERKLIDQIARNFTVISVTAQQWFLCGEIMMKLRRDKKVDREPVKGLPADILIALSVRGSGAVLITRNEKDFKLIREVYDFKYLTVD
ncbi:MAG: PIN domain-containing protein [Nitrospirota bacterium]